MKMRIAIAGLGIAGSYLYRLLSKEGYHADVYEIRKNTHCGLHPCAWGTSQEFTDLVREAGLDPDQYILARFETLKLDEVSVPADIMTFNKPQLVKDLSESADILYTPLNPKEYDRIIDATGVARAYLTPIKPDVIINCKQMRLVSRTPPELLMRPGGGGYAWSFPLGGNEVHVGCGCLHGDPEKILNHFELPGDRFEDIICGCSGQVRLTGPRGSRPFFVRGTPDVWGVGEAIGCVAPLAGDGVLSGMASTKILLNNWENPEGYTRAILKEFKWMESERRVVDKIVARKSLGLGDARVILENSGRMGIRIGMIDALILARALL